MPSQMEVVKVQFLFLHWNCPSWQTRSGHEAGSSLPFLQSLLPSHFQWKGTHLSSCPSGPHLCWNLVQLAMQVLLSGAKTKLSGQAQVFWTPLKLLGAMRHKWEQPPLLYWQGLS